MSVIRRPGSGGEPSESGSDRRYLELVRPLPRPTPAQADAFVEFVAGAHSWYKHLSPFPPGAPFTFFLDPNAGRALIRTPSGESAFVDRTDERDRFHYTWMLTSEYRERFGHWEYTTEEGTRLFVGSPKLGWQDIGPHAAVLDDAGDWLQIPADIAVPGTCRLTAHVHDDFGPRVLLFRGFPDRIAAFETLRREHPSDPDVRNRAPNRIWMTER